MPRLVSRAPRARWQRTAVVGFAAIAVLALGISIASLVELRSAGSVVERLVSKADRSAFLVAQLGRHVARLRAIHFGVLIGSADSVHLHGQDVTRANKEIDSAVQEVELLVGGAKERRQWNAFKMQLDRFRAVLVGAMTATEAHQTDRAKVLLGEATTLANELQDSIDGLAQLNQRESAALLRAAGARLSSTWTLEAILGAVLVMGSIVIGVLVVRIIRRQREQLNDYMLRLQAANLDLDAFAGRLAHDMRNVLSPLPLLAARVLRTEDAASRADIAARLKRTSDRATELLDALLAFSRAGRTAEPAVQSASLAQQVKDVLADLAPLVHRVEADVQVQVDDLRVACEPGLLQLVVANLVSNALKYVEGREQRRVSISSQCHGSWCELVVSDTGVGIPQESLARIFEPFYRVPGAKAGGVGIGLATVRRIVDAHDGKISVESEVGVGSTFRVRLRCEDSAEQKLASLPQDSSSTASA